MNTCENCHYFEATGIQFCARFRFYIEKDGNCNYFERWTANRLDSKEEMEERKRSVGYGKANNNI